MILAISLLGFLLPIEVSAQRTVSIFGHVYDVDTGKALEGVSVIASKTGYVNVLAFVLTEPDGSYMLTFNTISDTLVITVSGFNVESKSAQVTESCDTLDFHVKTSQLAIREVKIQGQPIERKKDTVVYYVEQFRDQTDRSIGEVLRKMPGIDVSESGGITYNGISINRFYIEGLDMLGDNYGVATNNVQAKDIASVEVLENHQPLKVLENWVRSDQAAINLKLKEGSRGVWNGLIAAGIGYRPIQWDFRATPMLFTKKLQTIMTYKTNNMGYDMSRDLQPFQSQIPAVLGMVNPRTPPVSDELWLNNNIHAASANLLVKTGAASDLTAKTYFIRDNQKSSGVSESIYLIPNSNPVAIHEEMDNGLETQKLGIELRYKVNASRGYFNETLRLSSSRSDGLGYVNSNGQRLEQRLGLPQMDFQNRFNGIIRPRKQQYSFSSNIIYAKRDSWLEVSPNPYPEFTDNQDNMLQTIAADKFRTSNSLSTAIKKGRWVCDISAGIDYDSEHLSSKLGLPDSLQNDLHWKRIDLRTTPSLSWNGSIFSFTVLMPVSWVNLYWGYPGAISDNGQKRWLLSPSASFTIKPDYIFSISGGASLSESLGDIYGVYPGYIMNNYRSFKSNCGIIGFSKVNREYLKFTYNDIVNALFANVTAEYRNFYQDLMYDTMYSGILNRTVAHDIPHDNTQVLVDANIEKRFSRLSGSAKLRASWTRTWADYLRQGTLISTLGDRVEAGLSLDARLFETALLSYHTDFGYVRSLSSSVGGHWNVITLQQLLSCSILLGEHVVVRISGRHFLNNQMEGDGRNLFFLDASFSYKNRQMEYAVEGRNLTNMLEYHMTALTGTSYYTYTYRLRPLSVVFAVRFSLK